MRLGQTTGARAILLWKNVFAYAAGTIKRFWVREKLINYTGTDIAPILAKQETDAAVLQTSQIIHEYNDLFCLQRDVTYTGKSRRWLYARALSTKTDQAYAAWSVYVRENMGTTNLGSSGITAESPLQLETENFEVTMQIQKTK